MWRRRVWGFGPDCLLYGVLCPISQLQYNVVDTCVLPLACVHSVLESAATSIVLLRMETLKQLKYFTPCCDPNIRMQLHNCMEQFHCVPIWQQHMLHVHTYVHM